MSKTRCSQGEIWFYYGMAIFQVLHYYLWDHQQNIGILFGAMMWFIIGKTAVIIRCIREGRADELRKAP